MLKTLHYTISNEQLNNVMEAAVEHEMDIYTIEGVLNDKHLIVNGGLHFGRQKPRKYIILDYTSAYVFDMTITMTDSEKAYNDFMKEYDQFIKEYYPEEA